MEKKASNWHPDQVFGSILPYENLSSFHSTLHGEPGPSVDCNTEEILVREIDMLEPTIATNEQNIHEIFKDLIENDDDFLDPFAVKIGEYFNESSNSGVEYSYEYGSLYPTLQQIQCEMEPEVKVTAMDAYNKLRPVDGIIEIQVETNQIKLVEEGQHLPTISSLPRYDVIHTQDVRKDTKYYNQKTTEEYDDVGCCNKENFEIVKSHNDCEKEQKSIQRKEIHNGTGNITDKNTIFKANHSPQSHKRIFKVGKPYTCGICNKSFGRKEYLQQHSLVHNDEKPHVCGLCNKSFREKSNLIAHSKRYHGEKPFFCNVCPKAFIHMSHLLKHSYIHIGERPFECKVCGKSFRQKGTLFRHSKLHIEKKVD